VILDHNLELRQMLALALETAGFDVVQASNEFDLHRAIAQSRPDALLIDLQHSESQGLQLVERMRNRKVLHEVPILFLAGSDDDEFEQQALGAGADWFGLRPVGLVELQHRVTELIERRRQRARLELFQKRVS